MADRKIASIDLTKNQYRYEEWSVFVGLSWLSGSGAKFRNGFNRTLLGMSWLRQRELHSRLRAPCCL